MDLVTLFIPVFFASMGVEAYVARRRGLRLYRGPDVVCDLSLGVLQVLTAAVFAGALAGTYAYVHAQHRMFDVPSTWWTFALALVGIDFLYYWFHRFAHRTHLGWASHAPHHSSEDYNLAVALRQGPLQPFVSRWFYLPLAWVGVSPATMATVLAVDTIAQFFVHTQLVGKLGPLEWVMNTPSHHRVHHGCDPKYLDRNHAGIFIVWDRMFGTFVPEAEAPTYGTVKPLASFQPIFATVKPFVDIAQLGWSRRRVTDLVQIWLRPPEWKPGGKLPVTVERGRAPFDIVPAAGAQRYAYAQFAAGLLMTVALLVGGGALSRSAFAVGAALVAVGFATAGGLLEGRRWARPLEGARVVALFVAAALLVAA